MEFQYTTLVATAILPLVLGFLLEKLSPAKHCPFRAVAFNLFCLVPFTVLRAVATALVMGVTVLLTNRLGGGIIHLPADGYFFIPAVVIYTVMMDLVEYLFHRAQHRIPVMWAMHSFHHSDESLNVSTTFRHFWAEQAIKACTIYLLIGLLFRTDAEIIAIYGAISLMNYFFHLNVCVGLGRAWFLMNSPQYHRVHHSSLAMHHGKNFAALFPVFDVIFGTAYRPQAHEYPPSGLHEHDSPRSVFEATIWPLRRLLRTDLQTS